MTAWVPRQPLAVVAPVTEAQDTKEPHKMKSRFTDITAALSPCRGQRGEGQPSGKRPDMVWPGRRGRAHLPGCPRKRSLGSVRVVRVVRARALIRRGSTSAYIKYRKKEVPGFVGAFRQAHTNTRLELPDRARRMRMSKTHTTNEAPKS